jgi:hypothetical protein
MLGSWTIHSTPLEQIKNMNRNNPQRMQKKRGLTGTSSLPQQTARAKNCRPVAVLNVTR